MKALPAIVCALSVGLFSVPALSSTSTNEMSQSELNQTSAPSQSELQQVAFERVGCGLRAIMWKDVYILSLYQGDQSAKMLRMDVVYDGEMPQGIPDDWRPGLGQVIDQTEIAMIDAAFGKLSKGDVVQFTYIPNTDESYVLVNSEVRLGTHGIGLYDTVQGMWLGDDPISSKIKRNIENRICDV